MFALRPARIGRTILMAARCDGPIIVARLRLVCPFYGRPSALRGSRELGRALESRRLKAALGARLRPACGVRAAPGWKPVGLSTMRCWRRSSPIIAIIMPPHCYWPSVSAHIIEPNSGRLRCAPLMLIGRAASGSPERRLRLGGALCICSRVMLWSISEMSSCCRCRLARCCLCGCCCRCCGRRARLRRRCCRRRCRRGCGWAGRAACGPPLATMCATGELKVRRLLSASPKVGELGASGLAGGSTCCRASRAL